MRQASLLSVVFGLCSVATADLTHYVPEANVIGTDGPGVTMTVRVDFFGQVQYDIPTEYQGTGGFPVVHAYEMVGSAGQMGMILGFDLSCGETTLYVPSTGAAFWQPNDIPMPGESLTMTEDLVCGGTPADPFAVSLAANYFELCSFPLTPNPAAADSVFASLTGLQVVYEVSGDVYIPNEINTIAEVDPQFGYRIYSSVDDTLTLNGYGFDTAFAYELTSSSWNWLAYPYRTTQQSTVMFDEMIGSVAIIMSDDGRAMIPAYSINSLGSCIPGEAYMVMVDQDITFSYPVIRNNTGEVEEEWVNNPGLLLETTHFAPVEPTGMPFAIVCALGENTVLQAGDEIAVFDGDLCVGAISCTGEWPLALTAWCGDPSNGMSGFQTGNPMSFRVWQASEELEEVANVVLIEGNGQFGTGPYAGVEIQPTSLDIHSGGLPYTFKIDQNFPNPFNPATSIRFTLEAQDHVRASIINIQGQRVTLLADHEMQAGEHSLVWEAGDQPSGIYFFRLESGSQSGTIKMTLLR